MSSIRVTPGEWRMLVEAFAGFDSWIDADEECDLLRAEVALAQGRAGLSDSSESLPDRCSRVAHALLVRPPIRYGNDIVTYEVVREMTARSGTQWTEELDEAESWSEIANRVAQSKATVKDLTMWIGLRTREGVET